MQQDGSQRPKMSSICRFGQEAMGKRKQVSVPTSYVVQQTRSGCYFRFLVVVPAKPQVPTVSKILS